MIAMTHALSSKIRNMAVLSALFVVVIHCRPNFVPCTLGWWVRQLLENGITQIAVPFFFTVSGFMLVGHVEFARCGLFCTRGWYYHAVFKRLRTLLLPFIIWNSSWILLSLPTRRIVDEAGSLSGLQLPTLCDYGLSPFGCPALVPLWYLRAVIILVLFSPMLLVLLRRFSWRILVAFYVVYGVCCPYVPMTRWTIVQDLTRCGFLPVQGFFYFSLGMALRLGIVRDFGSRIPTWLLMFLGLTLVVARAWFDEKCWSCYLGFASIPFLLYGIWRLVPTRTGPRLLTNSTFPIYLLHRFVQVDLLLVLGPSCTLGWCALMTVIPFAVPICVAVALRRHCPRVANIVFGGR